LSVGEIRRSLLRSLHNPRRCLMSKVLLCSNHSAQTDFITSTGLSSRRLTEADAEWLGIAPRQGHAEKHPSSSSTDWVTWGQTSGDGEVSVGEVQHSLIHRAEPGVHTNRVLLSSNNSTCHEFVLDSMGLCSVPLTNQDVVWMEQKEDLPKGTLFKILSKMTSEAPSPTEHAWEPRRRFAALARSLHQPRGAKSADHLKRLRLSDPLINLAAWHDWHALYEQAQATAQYRVHQQALIDRAMRAQASRLALASHAANGSAANGSSPRGCKRGLAELHWCEPVAPWSELQPPFLKGGERTSSHDSVMTSYLEDTGLEDTGVCHSPFRSTTTTTAAGSFSPKSPLRSPGKGPPLKPILEPTGWDLDESWATMA